MIIKINRIKINDNTRMNNHATYLNSFFCNHRNTSTPPLTPRVLFNGTEDDDASGGWPALEKLHTLTLYYLAQVSKALNFQLDN